MIVAAPMPDATVATLAARDAAREHWPVVVVGAGPAGAAAAWRLATRGIRTLLVDGRTFPREKVCGCCLSARALRELRDLGPDAVPDAAIPLAAVRLSHRGHAVRIALPGGGVVSRTLLDVHLVRRAIAAGCDWLPGVRVADIDERFADAGAPVTITVRCEAAAHEVRADRVILATGLAGHVRIAGAAPGRRGDLRRSRIGVGGVLPPAACDLPPGELVMAVADGGYCGLVRLEDGRIDVAAALDRGLLVRGADVARAVSRLLDEAGDRTACRLPGPDAIHAGAFAATPPLTRETPLVAGRTWRVFRVGDAAGYVEPFTGEGIGWALASARILAAAAVDRRGLVPAAEAASRYVAGHRRLFARLHGRCRFVAGALRSPLVVASAVAAARTVPWAARMLVPAVIGGSPPGERR